MVILAFDAATDAATSALVRDDVILGERTSSAIRILEDADELLREAELDQADIDAVAVGTGPGSFTGLRIGLAVARGLAFALGVPVAGVSTLAALAAGAPGAVPVVDARRREIFVLVDDEPRCLAPTALDVVRESVYVGSGSVRYRRVLEDAGAVVPPNESALHVPRAALHARLAREFGPAELVEPLYVREPDARPSA
jgi:tRNA threonylcarbamoyladenosine biosynthesis protein TsaB